MEQLALTALTAFVTTMTTKGAEAPARTFNNMWEYVFGPLDNFLIKHNENRKQDLNNFAESIHKNTAHIKPENLQEPQISILGPALEASKFYIDEKEIRDMFAKLIANSFDRNKNLFRHHSFVEIIRQMTPLDANNIHLFKTEQIRPIVNLILRLQNNSGSTIFTENLFVDNPSHPFSDSVSLSISNIIRLGLVDVDYLKQFTDKDKYQHFKTTSQYKAAQKTIESDSSYEKVEIQEGTIALTPFGKSFIEFCL